MNTESSNEPRDPRQQPGFQPELLALVDGEPVSLLNPSDPLLAEKQQFAWAYYAINAAYQELVEFRKAASAQANSATERQILRKIEVALRGKEAVEDRFASRGITATPKLAKGFTIDLQIQHVGTKTESLVVAASSSLTVNMSIPRVSALRARSSSSP
jgi:hypothetical protein